MGDKVLLGVAASLAGCGGEGTRDAGGADSWGQRPVAGPTEDAPGGRILDLADALTQEEERSLAVRLGRVRAAGSQPVLIVLLRPEPGDSLERFGWAARGGQKTTPLLILADPDSAQVRIEGDLAPERRALVASAMRERLRSGKNADAVLAGIDRLEQVAR